jgi:cell division protein FtsZ
MCSIDEVMQALEGFHMVFITAGMGGGTGTGAAPVLAHAAKEHGILTVGVVTKPFAFEGRQRARIAEYGMENMERSVDTLVVVPNQNLFRMVDRTTSLMNAFKLADKVLFEGVQSITDLIVQPGLINLDFADVRTVMQNMGKAMVFFPSSHFRTFALSSFSNSRHFCMSAACVCVCGDAYRSGSGNQTEMSERCVLQNWQCQIHSWRTLTCPRRIMCCSTFAVDMT